MTDLQSGQALTLPDPPAVDVHLHRVGGVERLVIVEDEDVTTQGVDPGRVHRCILGRVRTEEEMEQSVHELTEVVLKIRTQPDPEPILCVQVLRADTCPVSPSTTLSTCAESSRTCSLLSAACGGLSPPLRAASSLW